MSAPIGKFVYLGSDALDKPCLVSESATRLSGHAVQNWVFLRLIPLLLYQFIQDKGNPVCIMLLKLKEIVEIVCAPTITESDVAYLIVCVEDYLFERKLQFPDTPLKPKHHYLYHYPELILAFGPLVRLWTLRFESKHTYFKKCARKLQNFRNLAKTLATRHQILQAYYSSGSHFIKSIEWDSAIPFDKTLYGDDVQVAVSGFTFSETTQISMKVHYRNTEYKKGMFLIIGRSEPEGHLVFGEIVAALIANEAQLYFLVKVYESNCHGDMGLYEVIKGQNLTMNCIPVGSIIDYCPLPAYKQGIHLYISLKHQVMRRH